MSWFDVLLSPWSLLLTVAALLTYYLVTKDYDFFEKCGVKSVKPFPLLGNLDKVLCGSATFVEVFHSLYNTFPTEKIIGVYEFMKPVLMIRDPEIIKQITIKDFDHFMNHRAEFDENVEPLFGRSLVQMKNQKWKDMRSTLSPAFTGSKMRSMFGLVIECSKDFIDGILAEGAGKPVQLEMKDFFARFANDVIGTCAFGVKVNSWKDKENEFFQMGKVIANFEGLQTIKMFGYVNAPKLMQFLKISIWDEKVVHFFRDLVHGTMKYRNENHVLRPDMINLLMQARKGALSHADADKKDEDVGFATVEESEIGKSPSHFRVWEDDDLTAQCLIFFLAGFEAASTLMCYMTHELAMNPEIQKRLVEEIDEARQDLNGVPVTYEVLQKMKYLDMVTSETLRKWPPSPFTDRICTKPYQLEGHDGNKINVKVGDGLWLPTYSIQNDSKYFEDPERFNPERFSEENKNKIQPCTFFPFGVGPRNCIGSRFALMECKAMFFDLLSVFRIEMCEKTETKIKFKKNTLTMMTEKGFWFNLTPRNDK